MNETRLDGSETLTQTVGSTQKGLEALFAAAAFRSPETALERARFLRPEAIRDNRVSAFWRMLTEGKSSVEAATDSGAFDVIIENSDLAYSFEIETYARQIAKLGYLNAVGVRLSDIARGVGGFDYEAVRGAIADLSSEVPFSTKSPTNAVDGVLKVVDILNDPGDRVFGTGLIPLDDALGGLERKTLNILAGRPGMGKTTFGLNISENLALAGRTVLFVSLEMSEEHLFGRIVCGRMGIPWKRILKRQLTPEEQDRFTDHASDVMNGLGDRFLVEDTPGLTTHDIWDLTAAVRPDLLVVDHLALCGDKESQNENLRQGKISRRFKELAKALDISVLVLHQLSRGVEHRQNKRPTMADLRDSGEHEQNADNVLLLYRDSYYEPGAVDPHSETEIILGKTRYDTPNQAVRVRFNLTRQRFERIGP